MMASIIWISSLCAAAQLPTLENAMPVRVAGPWSVEVGPGVVTVDARKVELQKAVPFEVRPPERITVRDECHAGLPVFNPESGGWLKGAKLKRLIAEECTATGLLYPETVRVKAGPGNGVVFQRGTDYEFDPFWGTLGLLKGGAIAERQTIYIDYDYSPSRLDSVLVGQDGQVRLVAGTPRVALAMVPEPGPGDVAIVNIWVPGRTEKLTDENVYPIEFSKAGPAQTVAPTAEKLLPKTLAKLRAGETVTIVAWGDSVTDGGGVDGHDELWYQNQFAALLGERFPKAKIRMLTAGWGGANSRMYLEAPRGGPHDFVRDVLEPKPDLVTIEFVNDAYLDEAGTAAHYGKILEQIRGTGAEVVLIAPHLVRPDWLKSDTLKVDADPRPYVKGLRKFGADNHVALADASVEWCRLWRRGIPYITILANDINHPDVRGHRMFAETLLALFP